MSDQSQDDHKTVLARLDDVIAQDNEWNALKTAIEAARPDLTVTAYSRLAYGRTSDDRPAYGSEWSATITKDGVSLFVVDLRQLARELGVSA